MKRRIGARLLETDNEVREVLLMAGHTTSTLSRSQIPQYLLDPNHFAFDSMLHLRSRRSPRTESSPEAMLVVSPYENLRLVPRPNVGSHNCPSIQDRITCEGFKRVDGSKEVELSLPATKVDRKRYGSGSTRSVYQSLDVFAGHLLFPCA